MKKVGREFYRFFRNGLLLLILPMLVFGGIYLSSVRRAEETMGSAAGERLSRDAAVMDALLGEIRRSAAQFVSDDTVQTLGKSSNPTPEERYSFASLQENLQKMINTHRELQDICLWFPKSRSVLDINARFEPSQLEYFASTYYKTEFDRLEQELFGLSTGYHVYAGEDGGSLVFVQHMGIEPDSPVMAMHFKSSALGDYAAGGAAQFEEERAFILDGVIWTAGLVQDSPAEKNCTFTMLPGYEVFRDNLNGEDSLILAAASGEARITWLTALPYRYVRQQNNYIIRAAIAFTLLYVVCGAAIAWLFARQNYSPIDKIMKSLSLSGDRRSSEYAQIEQHMAEVLRRSERAEYALERSMDGVRSGYLWRLLRGDADPASADVYGVDFGSDAAFGLMSLKVTDYGAEYGGGGEVDDRTSEALLYSVRNVTEELAGCRSYSLLHEEQVLCILSAAETGTPAAEMERVSAAVSDFFREKLGVTLECRRSGEGKSLAALPRLYQELAAPILEENVPETDTAAKPSQTDAILRYVADHCCESEFSLAAVAGAFGMNASYLSRKFKAEVGVGFGEYAQNLRFERAKTLLRETGEPVAQVAEAVGYFSVSAFTAAFRKAIGVSPAAYRSSSSK